ncbi:hypothetical protein [Leptospira kanakyensis]|uniref:hypothetical protein n=1 Tax=Leptospira kanakyensis TaxID=2484968 RepID=UPI00223D4DAD|nr:hypothetical protein [Leptospira kanakyensis]MCW7471255.1 hypothetical protein [Leptospira kanakyensis]MCW7481990.1 hypothetical protein [Leptospira kanakyensis]
MNKYTFLLLYIFFVSCESSREKCYSNLEPDYKGFCDSIVVGYGAAENDEEREKVKNLSITTCLLGSYQDKRCKKERNWDIVDVF